MRLGSGRDTSGRSRSTRGLGGGNHRQNIRGIGRQRTTPRGIRTFMQRLISGRRDAHVSVIRSRKVRAIYVVQVFTEMISPTAWVDENIALLTLVLNPQVVVGMLLPKMSRQSASGGDILHHEQTVRVRTEQGLSGTAHQNNQIVDGGNGHRR